MDCFLMVIGHNISLSCPKKNVICHALRTQIGLDEIYTHIFDLYSAELLTVIR